MASPAGARSPGRFWAPETESDSEVEELGDADLRASQETEKRLGSHPESPGDKLAPEGQWETVKKKRRRVKYDCRRPFGYQWPWNISRSTSRAAPPSTWKGPLSKPRMSPKKTLGDCMQPDHAGKTKVRTPATDDRRQQRKQDLDPRPKGIRILNTGRVREAGPNEGPVRRDEPMYPALAARRQKLSSVTLPQRRTYLEAAMASGGSKGAAGGGTGGDGAGDRRRPTGHAMARGGFRGGRGRGRRSPSPPAGRGPRGRGKLGPRHADQGGRGRSRRQQEDIEPPRHHRGVEIVDQHNKVDIPQPSVGKHKAPETVGEPTAKKKKKATLQCAICLEYHHTQTCALLLGPKPDAISCSLAGKGNSSF